MAIRRDAYKGLRLMPMHLQKLEGMSTVLGVSPSEVMRQLIDNAQIGPVSKVQASATLTALPAKQIEAGNAHRK